MLTFYIRSVDRRRTILKARCQRLFGDTPAGGDVRIGAEEVYESVLVVLAYLFLILRRTAALIKLRDVLSACAAMVVMVAAADSAVTARNAPFGFVAGATPVTDPVIVAVGSTPIRLSDTRAEAAQARLVPLAEDGEAAAEVPFDALFDDGLLERTADHEALAQAAEAAGLDQALEVRAALALARREILSTAYLDMAVKSWVTQANVRRAYEEAAETMAAQSMVLLRRILVSSEAEAHEIRALIAAGRTVEEAAQRRSLDMTTRKSGGLVGPVALGTLPFGIRQAIEDLPIGAPSMPVKGKDGWYIVSVDGRFGETLPTFEDMADNIAALMEAQVVARVVAEARAATPMRVSGGAVPTSVMVANTVTRW